MKSPDPVRLWGRLAEQRALADLVDGARDGTSQVLVLRGEPGVGKTALLDYLRTHALGCHVASVSGVQAEVELPYAGLQRLCGPFLDRSSRLPGPQAEALEVALGSRIGASPDRFLVGLAALTLLSAVADEKPLVCVVDDAQWLDLASAEAFAFVARRVAAEPLALVFAIRDPGDAAWEGGLDTAAAEALAELPEMALTGLSESDSRDLLDATTSGPLEHTVRDRVVAETRGNPLALLELPHELAQPELSFGGASHPRGGNRVTVTTRLEAGFRRRVEELPQQTQLLMLVAAAEPTGDVRLLWRAAADLDVPTDAAEPAQHAGLLALGAHVTFRHPLVRSTVYDSALMPERRRVHAALAAATDPSTDPDRRAWHRAHATSGLDETVAADLDASAARAKGRGGLAASAAFLSRASELTPDPVRRAQRALQAASVQLDAGAPEAALVLLAVAEAGPLSDLERARGGLLRAQVSFTLTRGREAASLLLAAAKRLEPFDASLARETYLDAFAASLFAGRFAGDASVQDVAHAVLRAELGQEPGQQSRSLPTACDLLLNGLAVLLTQGHRAGTPMLQQALDAFRLQPMRDEDALRWLWLASRVARAIGDDRAWDTFTERHVRLARADGALSVLPIALTERFSAQLFAGHLSDATSLVAEADAVLQLTGGDLGPHIRFLLAAWEGREDEALALIETNRADVARRGEGLFLIGTDWTTAVFYNGLGRYGDAMVCAERAAQHPYELGLSTWVYPELVEAAVRSGQPERAHDAMAKLTEIAEAAATDWALGVAARSRALLTDGAAAEELYREAIRRLSNTNVVVTRARAHLLYGEWLRRERRRTDARGELRTAHEFFLDLGMAGYAERTRRELTATGETARVRSVDTLNDLTTQETQIARLAIAGHTNPEIAAQLFLSPRTVEWHLRKVFGKLGIRNRKQLSSALPALRSASTG